MSRYLCVGDITLTGSKDPIQDPDTGVITGYAKMVRVDATCKIIDDVNGAPTNMKQVGIQIKFPKSAFDALSEADFGAKLVIKARSMLSEPDATPSMVLEEA